MRAALTLIVAMLGVAAVFSDTLTSGGWPFIAQRFQTFVTIFLGIFIEAVPFLLAARWSPASSPSSWTTA
ncbi:MAG: hypothetical protein R3A10_21745 [Caldilineaceae bacterium]